MTSYNKDIDDNLIELKARNKELENFAFLAAHEINRPLRHINAFGQKLKTKAGEKLDSDENLYLEKIINSSRALQNLLEDLLQLSRISSQEKELEEVDLNLVISDVIEEFDEDIEKLHAQIEIESLATIEADKLLIYLLFKNLLSNALKFRKADQDPKIKIQSKNSEDYTEISFADNGIGFNEEDAQKIFRQFERLHGVSEYDGHGIGLALCKKIAKRHGGSITAHGIKNEGSTFTIKLPLKQSSSSSEDLGLQEIPSAV